MENYERGEVVSLDESQVPQFDGLPPEHELIVVKQGTKIWNVVPFALKAIKDKKHVVWSGCGTGIERTISCVEVMKRKLRTLHQTTRIRYKKVEEYWNPRLDGLDTLKVVREIPAIDIWVSTEPIPTSVDGYQAPGTCWAFSREPPKGRDRPQGAFSGRQPKRKPLKKTKGLPGPAQFKQSSSREQAQSSAMGNS
ncbi:unnamed protein product [Darwinula stevensoni]|uniref:DNA/RNA-binding protein Alba-like domain-containing protein n=1 Tax=Darwinula stevensoni TaxID=69355 RepID=A0A7R8XB34_9CRUS|nr:unnamed protein product [Darwinula stevensoni]CAG0890618.1 unnamed protein product [Darwinula stevensoni]